MLNILLYINITKIMLDYYQIIKFHSEEMSKAKSPNHGLSFLTSFQLCRPKDSSSMIKSSRSRSPAVSYMYSPISSRAFDISFPSFSDPPPPTPSKITPLSSAFRSKSCTIHEISSELENKSSTSHAHSEPRNDDKKFNSPLSSNSDHTDSRISDSTTKKKKHKDARKSISSGDSDETESLFSSHEYSHPLKPIHEEGLGKKPLKQKSTKARRFKRYGSKEWKGEEQCVVNEKVNQSFVVVKRSVDPHRDFKKSMSEMIVEKRIFEPKELEELLMSFLSLNSRMHHKVIIEAFTEVLKEIFWE